MLATDSHVDVAIVKRRENQDLPNARGAGLHARTIEMLDQRGVAAHPMPRVPKLRANSSAAVSIRAGKILGWKSREWGDAFDVDKTVGQANPDDYDALVLPGGVMNPDKLRMDSDAVSFVRKFFDDRKPVGAICHGPWTLIDAGVVKGRQLTSYPSLRQDLINAGAQFEIGAAQGLFRRQQGNSRTALSGLFHDLVGRCELETICLVSM